MDRELIRRIADLEREVRRLSVQNANTASRGVLTESYDADGIQRTRVQGLSGEELNDVQSWQQFGIASHCPPSGDVLILSMGGHRDGAQVLCSVSPAHRPASQETGATTLYDAFGNSQAMNSAGVKLTTMFGQTVTLSESGITIDNGAGASISMEGGDVTITGNLEVTGGSLTHNGTNVGDDHVHLGVVTGLSKSKGPA